MPASPSRARAIECPECHSRNVLVVLATTTILALHCLACEHHFAVDAVPTAPGPADGTDDPAAP